MEPVTSYTMIQEAMSIIVSGVNLWSRAVARIPSRIGTDEIVFMPVPIPSTLLQCSVFIPLGLEDF